MSVVHIVGAGPGAIDLLTVRATRLLAGADLVVFPGSYLDPGEVAGLAPGATLVDSQHLDLDQITEALVGAASAGQSVVRLASGDPSVYSALAEQTRRLDRAGVPWDVCPGVPAYAAAAALLGRELTVPEVAQTVILTRAQQDSTQMPVTEELSGLAQSRATLVLHLAVRHVRRLAETLIPHYGPDCPAVVTAWVSQPREQVLRGTLATIADQVEASGLRMGALIFVGEALQAPDDHAESHLYSCRPR
ncbi:MAG: cobalt-precorrin-4/precorrin-4 C(11)-methyltransferase [Actinomycetales bacterium]